MDKYYVNDRKQENGDHEVHNQNCKYLHLIVSKTYLGEHYNCKPAVAEARKHYRQVNGCYFCCEDCHTQ